MRVFLSHCGYSVRYYIIYLIAVLAMLKQISPTDLSKPQELREQIIREFSTVPYIRKLKLRQVKKAIALYNQEKEDAAMSEQEAPAADPPQTTE